MARDLPLSNGGMLVNFDRKYRLRDIYWPHVGEFNQTVGHACRAGIYIDDTFSWLDDEGWELDAGYEEHTLVTKAVFTNNELKIQLTFSDLVDFHEDLLVRKVEAQNLAENEREVRLFFHNDLHIMGTDIGNTAYYEPERKAVFHYKGKSWMVVNMGVGDEGETDIGLHHWSVGDKEIEGKQGTWKDAEDGMLANNSIAQGSVDSTVGVSFKLKDKETCWYWLGIGEDFNQVTYINRQIREKNPLTFLDRTRNYWSLWVEQASIPDFPLPDELHELYLRSLLIMRTQVDDEGAILAATDYDVTHFNRDTYAYMWPRDGALIADALIQAGYAHVTRGFFDFCHRVITEEGYLLHKFNPDGSLASSWQGWYVDGEKKLPVQEDETALVVWALRRHYDKFSDLEFIKPHYRGLVVRAANWMCEYLDKRTGLPKPSWDLWEERRCVHAWTTSTVWAALQAAASFADDFGETDLAEKYRKTAEKMKQGVENHLWSEEKGRFVRSLVPSADGDYEMQQPADASLSALWLFGMFPEDHPKTMQTMLAVEEEVRVRTDVGGYARYQADPYYRVSQDTEKVPGNPWFVTTMWLARWHIRKAEKKMDLEKARRLLEWALEHALASGVMPEQIHPEKGTPLSASPLTWSHAAYVRAVQEYIEKSRYLNR